MLKPQRSDRFLLDDRLTIKAKGPKPSLVIGPFASGPQIQLLQTPLQELQRASATQMTGSY
jgi:hypothetical protein